MISIWQWKVKDWHYQYDIQFKLRPEKLLQIETKVKSDQEENVYEVCELDEHDEAWKSFFFKQYWL